MTDNSLRTAIARAIHDGPNAQEQYAGAGIGPHSADECEWFGQYLADADAVLAVLAENPDLVGDEYHSMAELYEYRMLYNAHAAQGWLAAGIPVVKSWRHHDGSECFDGGWFIVVAQLPTGQVSNHYPANDWNLFKVPIVERAPEWDRHTPADVLNRMRNALGGEQ